jgi:hypothetical protein
VQVFQHILLINVEICIANMSRKLIGILNWIAFGSGWFCGVWSAVQVKAKRWEEEEIPNRWNVDTQESNSTN